MISGFELAHQSAMPRLCKILRIDDSRMSCSNRSNLDTVGWVTPAIAASLFCESP